MANQNIVTQFRALSSINKIGMGFASFNAIGLVLIVSQLSGVVGIKSEMQGAIDDAKRQFNTTLSETQTRITDAVDQAVTQISIAGTELKCSGTYGGSLSIIIPRAPSSYRLTGRVIGNDLYGSLEAGVQLSLPISKDSEEGTISLSCR